MRRMRGMRRMRVCRASYRFAIVFCDDDRSCSNRWHFVIYWRRKHLFKSPVGSIKCMCVSMLGATIGPAITRDASGEGTPSSFTPSSHVNDKRSRHLLARIRRVSGSNAKSNIETNDGNRLWVEPPWFARASAPRHRWESRAAAGATMASRKR